MVKIILRQVQDACARLQWIPAQVLKACRRMNGKPGRFEGLSVGVLRTARAAATPFF